MPTYAILGATGATGSSILRLLLEAPNSQDSIRVYVRSRSKLLDLFPSLPSRPDVQIYEGSIDDSVLMSECLTHTDAVFSCIAENENVPGLRIAQDVSAAIVRTLRASAAKDPLLRIPHIIVLSAAPVNPVFAKRMPAPVRWLVKSSFSHVYADLDLAQQQFRLENDWLPVTFVQPPGLTQGPVQGHQLVYDPVAPTTFLGYTDLAAAMLEVAERGPDAERDWVGVRSLGPQKPSLRVLLPLQLRGLLAHYFPKLWLKLRAKGWF